MKHGMTGTVEHRCWKKIRERCFNARCKDFPDYGGRGITICDRWETFANFLSDMGPRPAGCTSIDRLNVHGNYEPGNCRWATARQQARNRRSSRIVEHNGQRKCLAEWAEQFGINQIILAKRLARGWSVERALNEPMLPPKERIRRRDCTRVITFNGETRPLAEWAERQGLPYYVLRQRLDRGWPEARALTEPSLIKTRRGKS